MLQNLQTSLCGIVVLSVAAAAFLEGKIDWQAFLAGIAVAGGLLSAKDHNK